MTGWRSGVDGLEAGVHVDVGNRPLRVVPGPRPVDPAAAEAAARAFLTALGVPTDLEGTFDTPRRMTAAYLEMITPRPFEATTFPNDGGYDELVLARSIPVQSVCEHHMLPFVGVAHVGYLPGDRILGLSKMARLVEMFARRPQVQERLTTQIADWLQATLAPRGVGVVVEAEHWCMTVRGVRAGHASTVTSTLLGRFRDDARSRAEFLALAGTPSHTTAGW
jgi:GTP cyclohydrolase IA